MPVMCQMSQIEVLQRQGYGVGEIVLTVVEQSGIGRRATPHPFRQFMAAHLLRNHADLRHIQAILGHAQITSTEIHTHVGLEDLEEVARRAHPHGDTNRLLTGKALKCTLRTSWRSRDEADYQYRGAT